MTEILVGPDFKLGAQHATCVYIMMAQHLRVWASSIYAYVPVLYDCRYDTIAIVSSAAALLVDGIRLMYRDTAPRYCRSASRLIRKKWQGEDLLSSFAL
jgi:hypothetical protein